MDCLENPSKTAIKKISNKVRLHKKQSMPSYCTLFWFKAEIPAYDFFDQSEKYFINKHAMLKTYCFNYMLPPSLGLLLRFWENVKQNVFTFGTSLEDVKISGDITSRMCSTRISKTSLFSVSDFKLANKDTRTILFEVVLVSSLLTLNVLNLCGSFFVFEFENAFV